MSDFIPDKFMKMLYHEVLSEESAKIRCVPDEFKSQEMCNDVVFENPTLIKHVMDWFVTAEMLEKCKDEEWFEGFRRCKAQKAKIKEDLLPVTWYLDCVIDWCFSENEK